MGLVNVKGLLGPDRQRLQEVEFLVDTGAFYTLISLDLAERLGVSLPLNAPVILADQRRVEIPLGVAYLRLNGREAGIPVGAMNVPISLLGVTALEALGLKVDPVSGTLEPTRPFAAPAF